MLVSSRVHHRTDGRGTIITISDHLFKREINIRSTSVIARCMPYMTNGTCLREYFKNEAADDEIFFQVVLRLNLYLIRNE